MVTLDSGVVVPSADWVVAENQLPGTLDWVMSATSRIYGYSDRVERGAGDVVTLFVDPPPVPYRVELYRMGYYGGLGGRLLWRSATIAGGAESASTDGVAGHQYGRVPVAPHGARRHRRHVASGGVPVQAHRNRQRDDSGIHPAVRPRRPEHGRLRHHALGHDLAGLQRVRGQEPVRRSGTVRVGESGSANRSRMVSFDRPYDQRGWGAPDFTGNEFPLVFLAESLGLDVTYITDIDLHAGPGASGPPSLSVQPGSRRVLVERHARRRRRGAGQGSEPGVPRRQRRLPPHPPGALTPRAPTGTRSVTRPTSPRRTPCGGSTRPR